MLTTHRIRLAGLPIHVREWSPEGTATRPALLLLHGLGAHGGVWDQVAPDLAEARTVWAPDLAGHGRSGTRRRATYSVAYHARVMWALADALAIGQLDLVGHSMGGAVALAMALGRPGRVRRLVLVNAAGLDRRGVPWRTRLAFLPAGATTLLGLAPSATAVRGLLSAHEGPERRADDLQAIADSLSHLPPDRRAAVRSALGLVWLGGALRRRLGELSMPVTVIHGEADPLFRVAEARRAVAAMPRGRLVVVAGAGHTVMADRPRAFVKAVTDALDPVDAPPAAASAPPSRSERPRAGRAAPPTPLMGWRRRPGRRSGRPPAAER